MAGSKLATLIFLPQTKFNPTQKMSIEPINDKLDNAAPVIIGFINFARQVIEPCKMATGIAEKTHPFPIEPVITIIIIRPP